jgi:uncharacterized protein YgbK (DUF1537 family)
VLAGSCSRATLSQVDAYKNTHPSLAISVNQALDGTMTADKVAEFITGNRDRDPMVYSSAAPDKMRSIQLQYGQERVAHAIEQLFADAAKKIVADGFDRLVVAGGETSGAVVSGLQLPAVTIGPEIDPGVPALATEGEVAVALALKSGNFGAADFFDKALRILRAAA